MNCNTVIKMAKSFLDRLERNRPVVLQPEVKSLVKVVEVDL